MKCINLGCAFGGNCEEEKNQHLIQHSTPKNPSQVTSNFLRPSPLSSLSLCKKIFYLFIYVAVLGLNCSMHGL